ncbi:hypothetical protein V1505DRAFT_364976 [Lipomyces doorenjongii]
MVASFHLRGIMLSEWCVVTLLGLLDECQACYVLHRSMSGISAVLSPIKDAPQYMLSQNEASMISSTVLAGYLDFSSTALFPLDSAKIASYYHLLDSHVL